MKLPLLLFIISFISMSAFTQTAEDYANESYELFAVKNYEQALTKIDSAIAFDTTVVRYRHHRGMLLYWLDRNAEGYEEFLSAINLDSTYSYSYIVMGSMFYQHNELDNALMYYDKAIEHAESDSLALEYYIYRAGVRNILGSRSGAMNDLELAYKLDSTNVDLLNNLALSYNGLGRTDDAIEMLHDAIRISPDYNLTIKNLAWVYSEVDSFVQSKIYFEKALALKPNDFYTLNNKGFLHYKLKEYDLAFELINRSIEISSYNSYAYKNRALVYLAVDKLEEACADLSKADELEFQLRYGDEVKDLLKEHCEK